MRLVVVTGPGELELNYSFLPTFIGMNTVLKKEMEQKLKASIEGQPWTEETFDLAHELILDYLEKKFHTLRGLRDYLEGIKYVGI